MELQLPPVGFREALKRFAVAFSGELEGVGFGLVPSEDRRFRRCRGPGHQ
jgi:hypothetical protein